MTTLDRHPHWLTRVTQRTPTGDLVDAMVERSAAILDAPVTSIPLALNTLKNGDLFTGSIELETQGAVKHTSRLTFIVDDYKKGEVLTFHRIKSDGRHVGPYHIILHTLMPDNKYSLYLLNSDGAKRIGSITLDNVSSPLSVTDIEEALV